MQIYTFFAPWLRKIKTWFLKMFQRLRGQKPEPVTELTPENVEMIKNIRVMAFVIGMTRAQVEADIRKELTGKNLEDGLREIGRVYGDLDRIPKKVICKHRAQNGLTFSQAVKRHLK